MHIRKAVITAAGWGTRFLPATKSQPKEMLPLLGKPIIQYSVEEAVACGVELVVIVTALGKRSMEDHFDRAFELEHFLEQHGKGKLAEEIRRVSNMVDICYVRQKEQLGLGHAVLTAKNVVGSEPFILFLPDDIFPDGATTLKKMMDICARYESSVLAVKEVPEEVVDRYGVIKPRKVEPRLYQAMELVEKPDREEAPSRLAIMGRYVLTPDIFRALELTRPGRGQEIQLTDGLQRLAHERTVYAYEFEGERYDAGTLKTWLETTIALALRDPELGPGLREYLGKLL
ncbi:MAG: UTP--glucose-1-phosphate uridylyltransferase GalU [Dehalococcoidia bacterium]|nr:UTP--glucose-1-phosphate uridylyltransferase GalU [Dehalococcoidia bacterium]